MNRRGSRLLPCAAAAALLSLVGSGAAHAEAASRSESQPAFTAVVKVVIEQGWRVDFGKLCTELALDLPDGSCVFKQVSIQDDKDRGYPRGFNVPLNRDGTVPFVMIFHLSPLVGEFFIVSAEGQLIKAFYRTKGAGYQPLPNGEVQDEFEADLAYWLANHSRIEQVLEELRAQNPGGAGQTR